jgi:hypothetical protein
MKPQQTKPRAQMANKGITLEMIDPIPKEATKFSSAKGRFRTSSKLRYRNTHPSLSSKSRMIKFTHPTSQRTGKEFTNKAKEAHRLSLNQLQVASTVSSSFKESLCLSTSMPTQQAQ